MLVRRMLLLVCALLLFSACGAAPEGLNIQNIPVEPAPAVTREEGVLRLKVFSGNMWGIKFVSTYIDERFDALAERLESGSYDVVGLQEMWATAERERFLEATRDSYPYRADFHGAAGGGLVVLSKHPISEARFHQYSARGKWWRFQHGDYWGRKGVAGVRVTTSQGDAWFFVTHLHASYGNRDPDYAVYQMSQIQEARAVVAQVAGDTPAIIVGDFNRTTDTEHYAVLLEERAGDPQWRRVPEPAASERRIDFIFTRPGSSETWLVVEPVKEVMTELVPVSEDEPQPITDHPVLGATLELGPAAPSSDGDVPSG